MVAFDIGERRVGVAVSDATGLLARPVGTLSVRTLATVVPQLLAELARLSDDDAPLAGVVIGLPRRLDGTPTGMTAPVERIATALAEASRLPVHLQDERLTSVEAESRLARRERDWRERKQRIDAEAASIILQDYLDACRPAFVSPDEDA